TEIDDGFFATISRFLLPSGGPLHDGVHELVHAANGVHFLAAFAEGCVDVNAGAGDTHPHGAEVFEDNPKIGRLAKNTHVRENAAVHEIMRAETVAAVLLTLVLAPLSFLDFTGDGRDNDVALELHSCTLKCLDCVRVAD